MLESQVCATMHGLTLNISIFKLSSKLCQLPTTILKLLLHFKVWWSHTLKNPEWTQFHILTIGLRIMLIVFLNRHSDFCFRKFNCCIDGIIREQWILTRYLCILIYLKPHNIGTITTTPSDGWEHHDRKSSTAVSFHTLSMLFCPARRVRKKVVGDANTHLFL
jgi:hypothetical protein